MISSIKDNVKRRTKRLEARVTQEEYDKVSDLADICGLSLSNYIRKVSLGQHPRQRLTLNEIEALGSLDNARNDIARVMGPVKRMMTDERAREFNNPKFIERWIMASEALILRWKEIMDYISR